MFIGGDSDAANPLILRHSTGDQQCRYAGLLSAVALFRSGFQPANHLYRTKYLSAGTPAVCGHFFDGAATGLLQDLPLTIRPLLSNGLLVGILLAVLMENLIPWERIK